MISALDQLGPIGGEMARRARAAGVFLIWRAQVRASRQVQVRQGKTEGEKEDKQQAGARRCHHDAQRDHEETSLERRHGAPDLRRLSSGRRLLVCCRLEIS